MTKCFGPKFSQCFCILSKLFYSNQNLSPTTLFMWIQFVCISSILLRKFSLCVFVNIILLISFFVFYGFFLCWKNLIAKSDYKKIPTYMNNYRFPNFSLSEENQVHKFTGFIMLSCYEDDDFAKRVYDE